MNEKDALYEIASAVWRRKWTAVLVFVLLALPPLWMVSRMAEEYRATAMVHISQMPGLDPDNRSYEAVYVDPVSLRTEVDVLRSEPLALQVIERLGLVDAPAFAAEPPSGMALAKARLKALLSEAAGADSAGDAPDGAAADAELERVLRIYMDGLEVQNDGRSALAGVSFTADEPELARTIANAHAQAYLDSRAARRLDPYQAANVRLVAPARLPEGARPGSAKTVLAGGMGLALLIALLAAWLRDRGTKRHHRLRVLAEQLSLRPLVSLPVALADRTMPKAGSRRTLYDERIRSLARLMAEDYGTASSVFVVTSALPGEGAALVSASLARGFEALGYSTCLVDADLRRRSLDRCMSLPAGSKGVSDVIKGDVQLPHAPGDTGLRLLPAGTRCEEAVVSSTRSRFAAMFDDLRSGFEIVIVSAPPLCPVPDALMAAPEATATIFVARSDRADLTLTREALGLLRGRSATLAGLVLTGEDPDTRRLLSERATRDLVEPAPFRREDESARTAVPLLAPATPEADGRVSQFHRRASAAE